MHPIDGLSEAAKIAYRAYLDMSDSKTAHFTCLETIENRYKSGGAPSAAENLELEKLLASHDKNVLAFKTAMAAVKDREEREKLIRLMS